MSAQPDAVAGVISTVSVTVDLPLAMPRLPERGGDVLGTAGAPAPGGGFNIVAAAARQGVPTALLSPVGDGPNGRAALAALRAEGVAVLLPPEPGAPDTGLCVTITEPDGERTFLSAPGIEARLTREMLTTAQLAPGSPRPGDVVVVSGYDLAYSGGPALAAWIADLPPDIGVIFDPGPLVGELDAEALRAVVVRCDVLSVNEREAALLGGESALASLAERHVVLQRVGERGCTVWRGDRREEVPSVGVTAVDSTGAGDAHTGVFAAELVRGTPLLEAVTRANVAGALTASRWGSATSPTQAEIDEVLAATRRS